MQSTNETTKAEQEGAKTTPQDSPNEQIEKSSPTGDDEKPEESSAVEPSKDAEKKDEESSTKRFIPDYKKPDAALTFPEKLMSLMKFADTQDSEKFCVAWLEDGKSFVIRNPDEFTRQVLPKYFKATKFSSFTRKLYRWGFRQVNRGIGPDDPIIFGNDFFQRDNLELMAKMRSVTAATTRKIEQSNMQMLAQKRALETMDSERDQKRMLFDLMQNKGFMNQAMFNNNGGMNMGMNMNMNMGMNMNLANALRQQNFANNTGNNNMKPFDFMNQGFQPTNPLMNMNGFPQGMGNMNMGGMMNNNSGNSNGGNGNMQFPNPTSTAEIVNAAINALRYAP